MDSVPIAWCSRCGPISDYTLGYCDDCGEAAIKGAGAALALRLHAAFQVSCRVLGMLPTSTPEQMQERIERLAAEAGRLGLIERLEE